MYENPGGYGLLPSPRALPTPMVIGVYALGSRIAATSMPEYVSGWCGHGFESHWQPFLLKFKLMTSRLLFSLGVILQFFHKLSHF